MSNDIMADIHRVDLRNARKEGYAAGKAEAEATLQQIRQTAQRWADAGDYGWDNSSRGAFQQAGEEILALLPAPTRETVVNLTNLDLTSFQRQYGTLWRAAEHYLDGKMPDGQAAAFEQVVDFALVNSVAQTRILTALVAIHPCAGDALRA